MINGIEDFLERAEGVVQRAGRVRRAYKDAQKPAVVRVQEPQGEAAFLDTTLKTYLTVGGVALVAWFLLARKQS